MSRDEKTLDRAVLIYPVRDNKVLLAWKPKSNSGEIKIGEGFWNGTGGGIEEGEGPLITAMRESLEEWSIRINRTDLVKAAILYFRNIKTDGSASNCIVHVFLAVDWKGEPQSSKEMVNPTFFEVEDIPFDEMMPSDRYWLPRILRGEQVIVRATIGPRQKALLSAVDIQPMGNTMDCEICGELDINPVIILPLPNGKGAYNTLACEKCAEESGCYCKKHKRPHIGLASGKTRCILCPFQTEE